MFVSYLHLFSFRAHDDLSIERKHARDSHASLSDDEATSSARKRTKKVTSRDGSSDEDGFNNRAFMFMKQRAKAQEDTARATLEIAQRREKWEEALQLRDIRLKERQMYFEMVRSGDPDLVGEGKRGLQQLREEEKVE